MTTKTTRGLLGTKLGMTQVWDEHNKLIPVTVVQAMWQRFTLIRVRRNVIWHGVRRETCVICAKMLGDG